MKKLYYLMIAFLLTITITFAQIPTNGLVAYYPFNGNANDESGNGHHGILHGDPMSTFDRKDHPNSAYRFDGVDDYISISDIPLGDISHPKTFCAWFKLNSLDTEDWVTPFCQRRSPDEGANRWLIEAVSNHIDFCQAVDNIWSGPPYMIDATIDITSYHFLVAVFSNDFEGGKCRIYLDGIYKGSLSTQNLFDFGTELWIQREQGWSGIANRRGSVDDIRIYNRVLNEAEINLLYHEFDTPHVPILTNWGSLLLGILLLSCSLWYIYWKRKRTILTN